MASSDFLENLKKLQLGVGEIINHYSNGSKIPSWNSENERKLVTLHDPVGKEVLQRMEKLRRPTQVVQQGNLILALFVGDDEEPCENEAVANKSDASFVTAYSNDNPNCTTDAAEFVDINERFDANDEEENIFDNGSNKSEKQGFSSSTPKTLKRSLVADEPTINDDDDCNEPLKVSSSSKKSKQDIDVDPFRVPSISPVMFRHHYTENDKILLDFNYTPRLKPRKKIDMNTSYLHQSISLRLDMSELYGGRVEYTREEVESIYDGIVAFGEGQFKLILFCFMDKFHHTRTPVKLYNKWRQSLKMHKKEDYLEWKFNIPKE
jgi:hypothetical protein